MLNNQDKHHFLMNNNLRILGLASEEDGDLKEDTMVMEEDSVVDIVAVPMEDIMVLMVDIIRVVLMAIIKEVLTAIIKEVLLALMDTMVVLMADLIVVVEEENGTMSRNSKNKR
jgi:hypothetical protein